MESLHPVPDPRGSTARMLCLALACGLGLLIASMGCSTPESTTSRNTTGGSDPLAGVPRDFQLDVQVLVGAKVEDRDRLERRRVHMVLLPDGALHAATGDEVIPGSRPGLARILYRDQVADLWALLKQGSFIGSGEPVIGPVRQPGAKEIVYIVEYTKDNTRRRIVERQLSKDARENATTMLVRSLGAMAWLRDRPIKDSTVMPIRYDFGPDPWARYRTVDEGG